MVDGSLPRAEQLPGFEGAARPCEIQVHSFNAPLAFSLQIYDLLTNALLLIPSSSVIFKISSFHKEEAGGWSA